MKSGEKAELIMQRQSPRLFSTVDFKLVLSLELFFVFPLTIYSLWAPSKGWFQSVTSYQLEWQVYIFSNNTREDTIGQENQLKKL